MTDRPSGSPLAALLDQMISSADAACERYKQAADDQGRRSLPQGKQARKAQQTMEYTLARLRARRAALD